MIYVGYQGIGKSSISGRYNCIDLESGNFYVDNNRNKNWYKVYVNIAEHLSKQGYNVFMSSHKVVREELNKRNIYFRVLCPAPDMKKLWIERLQKRFNITKLDKDYRALKNAEEMYEQNIKDLMNEKDYILINEINYDLIDFILEKENKYESKRNV